MKTIQLNIPDELEGVIRTLSVDRQSFIVKAIRERLARLNDKKLEKQLVEGYQASCKESKTIAKEFENIDFENLDEY